MGGREGRKEGGEQTDTESQEIPDKSPSSLNDASKKIGLEAKRF